MTTVRHLVITLFTLAIATILRAAEPNLRVRAGFAVEQIAAANRETHGSWISLAIDRQGIAHISAQQGPLYRLPPGGPIERIDLPIGGVHGMTWIGDDLYAIVGEPDICQTGLYRLCDSNGDGILDNCQLLKALEGRGEHGPHAVFSAANGRSLLVLAGNATRLPSLARSCLAHLPAANSLLPPLPAHMGSESRGHSHGGWLCQTDLEGREWQLLACGLRNAYALAANAAGELFTADSDTEFEYGLPWYRPNRLLHLVSGADFGWRSGALKARESAPDLVPPVASLGAGSPTAVVFAGTASQYPARYQSALFIGDWSHGRLLAVHLRAAGATYTGEVEEIVVGSPLPIAAACINPKDGMLYFVAGGRNTESRLYRLTWRGTTE